jgi:hypothetical protein
MAQTNPSEVDDEVSSEQDTAGKTDSESTATDAFSRRGSESVAQEVRDEVLARDEYRCQVCGRRGPERGGLATLHAHHIEREPTGYDENEVANLTTLCRSCHSWVHQQSSPDEAPISLTEEDLSVLLPQDIEILRYLADNGPARTGEVTDALTAELSPTTVRERLAVLMGLDNQVETRDRQIVDQDVQTGAWGLVEQIEHSARGHIPTDPQALIQRVEDEQVRQALEQGCNRQTVMDVMDISRRTTFHKQKRARAYDFPLDAFRRGGDGGQHPAGSTAGERESVPSGAGADGQQQLDTVGDETADDRQTGHVVSGESAQQSPVEDSEVTVDGGDAELREQLEMAITALQRITVEL